MTVLGRSSVSVLNNAVGSSTYLGLGPCTRFKLRCFAARDVRGRQVGYLCHLGAVVAAPRLKQLRSRFRTWIPQVFRDPPRRTHKSRPGLALLRSRLSAPPPPRPTFCPCSRGFSSYHVNLFEADTRGCCFKFTRCNPPFDSAAELRKGECLRLQRARLQGNEGVCVCFGGCLVEKNCATISVQLCLNAYSPGGANITLSFCVHDVNLHNICAFRQQRCLLDH